MRNGRVINVLSFNSHIISCGNPEPVVVEYINDGKFEIETFSDKGGGGGEYEDDLMMRDDDYLEKQERGEYQSGQIRPLCENASNSMPLNLTRCEAVCRDGDAGNICFR